MGFLPLQNDATRALPNSKSKTCINHFFLWNVGKVDLKVLNQNFIKDYPIKLTYHQIIKLLQKDFGGFIPGWKSMAAMAWSCHYHTMIMAKYGHDHAMITAWRPCFLAWSPWFMAWSCYDYHVFYDSYHDRGMIIVFCMFFLKKKLECFVNFFQIVRVIYHYMAHLTAFRNLRL